MAVPTALARAIPELAASSAVVPIAHARAHIQMAAKNLLGMLEQGDKGAFLSWSCSIGVFTVASTRSLNVAMIYDATDGPARVHVPQEPQRAHVSSCLLLFCMAVCWLATGWPSLVFSSCVAE